MFGCLTISYSKDISHFIAQYTSSIHVFVTIHVSIKCVFSHLSFMYKKLRLSEVLKIAYLLNLQQS